MKIAITGSAGFLGRETVAEALRLGHQVVAVTRSPDTSFEMMPANLDVRECDLRIESDVRRILNDCDCVIHLAADLQSGNSYDNTINLTKNVLEAMQSAGTRRLVLCSSIAVLNYVDESAMNVIDETTARCENECLMGQYAAMKHAQERLAESWQVGQNSLTIVRPGLVYDAKNLSSAHAGFVKSGVGIAALHGGQVPLVYNNSVAQAMVAACDQESSRGLSIYHLVDDHLPSQRDYLKTLRSAGTVRAYLPLPWRLYGLSIKLLRITLESLGLRSRLPDAFFANSVAARCKPFAFSNRKSREALGWKPRQTRL